MSTNTNDLATYLNISHLMEDEQAAYITKFSTIVLDGALAELMSTISDEELEQLNQYLSLAPSLTQLVTHLQTEHASFQDILADHITQHHLVA